MEIKQFFEKLWADYISMAPRAAQIAALFAARGELVENDHVAFRTLDMAPLSLEALEPHLLTMGYTRFAPYYFAEKQLRAWSYLPPEPGLPRIFLSELITSSFSAELQTTLAKLMAQVDVSRLTSPEVFWAGRLWNPISFSTYERLLAESEYAAWVATLGLRPNHFTISINALQQSRTVEEVIEVVEAAGFVINAAGGKVKGKPSDLLEQAATLADRVAVTFADGMREVPSCYYEFALRHRDAAGHLYEGFVATSADKIFESTYLGSRSS